MHRRKFIEAVAAVLIAALRASTAQSQPARLYRIGFLGTTSAFSFANRVDAFRGGLRDLGYIEGKNLVIEYRWADGDADRLPKLAAELVRLRVDVLVTHAQGAYAAKRATASIPIVMAYTADAVGTGLVASLGRPEANVTGSTALIPEITAKRLELLKCIDVCSTDAIRANFADRQPFPQLGDIARPRPTSGAAAPAVPRRDNQSSNTIPELSAHGPFSAVRECPLLYRGTGSNRSVFVVREFKIRDDRTSMSATMKVRSVAAATSCNISRRCACTRQFPNPRWRRPGEGRTCCRHLHPL